ncbi:MAG: hypothetical protein LBT02_03865 [Rickettsiales bacterium]|jgi:hypothetical protein|nr:hypothetical protein [Rickettsiales bacterium]
MEEKKKELLNVIKELDNSIKYRLKKEEEKKDERNNMVIQMQEELEKIIEKIKESAT